MEQFDNIRCPKCGREYSGLLSTCPYCELGLDATTSLPKLTREDIRSGADGEEESVIVWPDPVEPQRTGTEQTASRTADTQTDSRQSASGEQRSSRSTADGQSVQKVSVARQKKDTEEKGKAKTTVSGWVTGIVCIILGIAVLIGVILMLRSMGIFSSEDTDQSDSATLPISSTPSESSETELSETGDTTIVVETEEDTAEEETDEVVWPSEEDAVAEEETTVEDETEDETGESDTEIVAEENEPSTDSVDVDCDSISISYSDISLFNIGETCSFTVTTVPASASAWVTWESSDIAVCTVDSDGTVTAVNGGTATITATCGDQTASCIVRCSFESVDTDELFTLSSTDITLFYPGEQAQLTISNLDEDSDLVDWESSDSSVATVENGLVTAVGNGTATVTATLNSGSVQGQSLTCVVRCSLADSDDEDVSVTGSYSLSTYDATMTRDGEYFQLTVESDETDVIPSHTWTSADTDVCYVDEFGVVYAVGNGTTTVSTTVDGQYLQCIVRVNISE